MANESSRCPFQNAQIVYSSSDGTVVTFNLFSPLRFRLVAEQDERLQCFASVGVDAYVSVQLSFLDESELSCTRAVARSFCPEFDHHMEVPCDLLPHSSRGETRSLAEELQGASAVFTLWNRGSRTGSVISDSSHQLYQKMNDLSMLFLFYASSWRRVHW